MWRFGNQVPFAHICEDVMKMDAGSCGGREGILGEGGDALSTLYACMKLQQNKIKILH